MERPFEELRPDLHRPGATAFKASAVPTHLEHRGAPALPLLEQAPRLGGEVARATAAEYPALAPLLTEP